MRYGLIGEKLGHSFSKIIHEQLADYTYDLIPLSKEEFPDFMQKRPFSAINVTIPYKEAVIPYLYQIEEAAKKIGAVNTIVNRNGQLYGYNTDYFGFRYMLEQHKIAVQNKKVLILGNGGATKAVYAVLQDMGASEILKVYYKQAPDTISYDCCYTTHTDAQIIVNTTPVGMYPNIGKSPIQVSKFPKLQTVVDVVYNPLRTSFLLEGQACGCTCIGGLEMLVAQAKYAVEIFLDKKIENDAIQQLVQNIIQSRSNLVLIGMSGCGKSTIGAAVAKRLNKTFVDTDACILEKIKMSIADYFAKYGEAAFRDIEQEVIAELSGQNDLVISTGGGVVVREENIWQLKQNGFVVWLRRDPAFLESGNGRPLVPNAEAAKQLYQTRIPLYTNAAETVIDNDADIETIETAVAEAYRKQSHFC